MGRGTAERRRADSESAPDARAVGQGIAAVYLPLDALVKAAGHAVLRDAPAGDAPTYKGDPGGREFNESVEDEVDSLTCPHCGGKVPRG